MCLCICNSSHHFTSLHTITIYVRRYEGKSYEGTFVRTFVGRLLERVREEHRPRPCLRATSVIFNAKAEVRFDERQRGPLHFLWQETIRVRKQETWHRHDECPQVHQKAPKEFHFLYTTCICRSFGCNGSQPKRSKQSHQREQARSKR